MKYLLVTDEINNKYIYLGKSLDKNKEFAHKRLSYNSGNVISTGEEYLANRDIAVPLKIGDIFSFYGRSFRSLTGSLNKDAYEVIKEILKEFAK